MAGNEKNSTENLIYLAWGVSLTALFGSLYFSEIKNYLPCELCWYQRILMYPNAVILGIAAVKKDRHAARYTAALSGIGMFLSLYHYLIQKLPVFAAKVPACGQVSCTGQYINWMGFITIPFLALIAFIIIFILSILLLKRRPEEETK